MSLGFVHPSNTFGKTFPLQVPIIFQDEHIMLINKPSGMAAQPNQWNEPTSFEPVHRLDQRVSGLMLLAKNKQVFASLSQAFANRLVQKKYRAVVANKPAETERTLEHWLVKDARKMKAKALQEKASNSKKGSLHYQLVQSSNRYHLLEIELHTGRFHQIRAQLVAIGSPIVGDVKYGYPRTVEDGSIFLQCSFLGFAHPFTKEAMSFDLPVPEAWKKYGFD